MQGIGWRELEGSWVLLYDNKFTGFMSAVTTAGTARFTIPATGHAGLHIVEMQHSDFGSPYRNTPAVAGARTARTSGSTSRSRRARRCCRHRPSGRRRKTVRTLAAAGRIGRDAGIFRESEQPVVVSGLGL